MKQFTRGKIIKALLVAASVIALGIIAGCASGFAEPFDMNNLFFDYTTVSDSNGKYIVITKHLVSQTDVKIPDTIYEIPVREIADSVFTADPKIKSVTFGQNMRVVGSNAFGKCPNLQSVTFNSGLTDVGEYAFSECPALSSAALPESLVSVGRGAFYGCSSLSDISVPAGIGTVGGRAFYGTAWLHSQAESEYVTVGDGILIACNSGRKTVTVPNGVKQIAGAFAGNTTVETMILNKDLKSVGDMSFMGCSSLKSVNLPSGVTDIGANAFYGCSNLQKLTLGDKITSIGAEAFSGCGAAIYLKKDSAAEKYCIDNGLDYFVIK